MPEVVWKFDAQGGRFVKATLDESEKITLKLEKSIKRLEDRATLKKAQEGSEKYQNALKQVRGEVEKTDKAARRMGESFATTANQTAELALKMAALGKTAIEVAERGAQLKALEDSFVRLGGTADALREVRDALAGTVDDATIMRMINTAKSLGVAEDQLASLAKIAKVKSAEIGQDVGYLFESLVTGVARKSIPIIDNAGIVMAGASDKIGERLRAIGTTAEAASDDLQKWAFAAEVVARSGVDMGTTIETSADSLARSQAELQNRLDQITIALAERLVPALEKGTSVLFKFADGLEYVGPALADTAGEAVNFVQKMAPLLDPEFWEGPARLGEVLDNEVSPAVTVHRDLLWEMHLALRGVRVMTNEATIAAHEEAAAVRELTAARTAQAMVYVEQGLAAQRNLERIAAAQKANAEFEARQAAQAARAPRKTGRATKEEQDPNIAFLSSFQDRRSELEQARDFIVSAQEDIADAYTETTARLADQLQQRREMEEETANSVANIMDRMNAAVDSSRAARMEEAQAQQAYISGIGGFVNAVAGAAGANAWVTAILGASQETALGLGALATPGMQESAFLHFASAAQHIVTQGIASQFKSGGGGGSAARASASASAVAPRPPADLTGERGGGEGMVLMVDGRVLGEASVKGANKSSRFTGITLDQRISGRRGRTIGG